MQTTTRHEQTPKPKPAAPKAPGGEGLPAQTAGRMSAAFGHDFSSVRIFHDDASDEQAAGLGAQAFAEGGDLFFQKGFYDPHGAQGQRLLAHELAHVVQEQRFGTGGKPTSEASDASEREAEYVAGRAAAGEPVQVRQAPGAVVARREDDDGEFARGQRRLQALENYGKVSQGLSAPAPSPAVPQPGVAPAPGTGLPTQVGLSAALAPEAGPPTFSDLGGVQAGLAGGVSAPRGTRVIVGGEPLILGGGNSPEAQIRGSRLPNLGTYPEIAGGLRGFGLDDSQMAFAQEIYRRTGQMPEGAGFAGLRTNPEAPGMFNRMGLLNSVEGMRVAQHPTDLSIANHLVIGGETNFDGMYGSAPADPAAKPSGGELPATHQMAGASDRAITDRLALLQDPELMDRLRSSGQDPMRVLLNDQGRGGAALGRRTQLVGSRLGLFDNLLEGGPPADHAEAVPFALDKLSPVPTPAGRNLWPGVGPGTRGSGEGGIPTGAAPTGGEGAAPTSAGEPLLAPPAPDARLALPAPDPVMTAPTPDVPTSMASQAGPAPAEPGAAPAGDGAASGAGAAGEVHLPLGRAGVMGGAGGAGLAAIHDLAIKHDFSLDSAGDIAVQGGAGAAGNVAQESLAARLGGDIAGTAKAGGVVGAVTSGLFSTYNNGELYRQGKETAGQATANTVVDTGVGLGSGLAGAAAGAAIGSIIPGAGTLVGAGVGFLGGMAASYATNWAAEHSGFTHWAKQGLGNELNHFNGELSGVWNGVGHATEGIHGAWDAAKGGLRHAGHAVADGASHALHGAEHFGANALHGAEHVGAGLLHRAEHLGSNALHGAEHFGADVLHGGEHLAARALHGGEHLLHGAEHLGSNLLHGGEHLAARALHGGEHLLHSAEHFGANALHGVEHAGANAFHGAEHLGANALHGAEHLGSAALHGAEHFGSEALHGAENVAHGVGDAASGAWHKLTSWF